MKKELVRTEKNRLPKGGRFVGFAARSAQEEILPGYFRVMVRQLPVAER